MSERLLQINFNLGVTPKEYEQAAKSLVDQFANLRRFLGQVFGQLTQGFPLGKVHQQLAALPGVVHAVQTVEGQKQHRRLVVIDRPYLAVCLVVFKLKERPGAMMPIENLEIVIPHRPDDDGRVMARLANVRHELLE